MLVVLLDVAAGWSGAKKTLLGREFWLVAVEASAVPSCPGCGPPAAVLPGPGVLWPVAVEHTGFAQAGLGAEWPASCWPASAMLAVSPSVPSRPWSSIFALRCKVGGL